MLKKIDLTSLFVEIYVYTIEYEKRNTQINAEEDRVFPTNASLLLSKLSYENLVVQEKNEWKIKNSEKDGKQWNEQ